MTTASAPGKIILLGEHSVVYGRPALAIPVRQVGASARVEPADDDGGGGIRLVAPALGFDGWLDDAPEDHPLAAITRATLAALQAGPTPALRLTVESTIPIAAGLGSSAAVSVAIARALNRHLGGRLTTSEISDLAYQVERIHHGTPSGIDNAVVAHDLPIFFLRGHPPQALTLGAPLGFVIGDTGVPAPTVVAVEAVRHRWQADRPATESTFDAIAELVDRGRRAILDGSTDDLGRCMNQNHSLLRELGVSSPGLDRLVESARAAGALGAKMSGGGMGGNMVALVPAERLEAVGQALDRAGAARQIRTQADP